MSISRRGFIGGAAAAAVATGTAEAGTTKKFEGYPGRYGLLHDTTLCVGCRSCEVACKEVNGLPAGREARLATRRSSTPYAEPPTNH